MVFDLDPYIYSGQEKKGAEPELNRKAFLKTCDVASMAEGPARLAFALVLRQDDWENWPAHLRSDPPPVRLRHGPLGLRDLGRFLVQQHPARHDDGVERRQARGQGLLRPQPERAGQDAGVDLLAAAEPVGRRLDARALGRAPNIYPPDFTLLNAYDRVAQTGDLWAKILDAKHDLAAMIGALEEI